MKRVRALTHADLEKYALQKPDPKDDPDADTYAQEDEYSSKVARETQAEIDQKALDRNTVKNNDTKHYVTFFDYGARADGVADDSSAFDRAVAAASAGDTIYVPRGTYKLSDNVTIPSGMEVEFESGACLSIDTGKVFTVNGTLKAGLYQIFDGAGTASLADGAVSELRPQWWGKSPFHTLAVNDATPSVGQGMTFKTFNTSPTTITYLDDGFTGQVVMIVFQDVNNTIDFSGTLMKGNGGVDWTPAVNDHMTCICDGVSWFCDLSPQPTLSSAVSVYLSADQDIADSESEPVEFDSEVYDVLGEFNTTTHVFTATQAGKYIACFQVVFQPTAAQDRFVARLVKNETTMAWVRAQAADTSYESVTGSKVIELAVNDEVHLEAENMDNDGSIEGSLLAETYLTIARIH
jgi:hypothetical protein